MSSFRVQLVDGPSFSCRRDQTLLDGCLVAGISAPYNCRSGECGECVAQLLEGEVCELPGADPAIFGEADRVQGRRLTCLSYPRSNVKLSMQLRAVIDPPISEFDAVMDVLTPHGQSIVEVSMTPAIAVDYRPGQYFEWLVPGVTPNRSYSVANRPGGARLEFHLRLYEGGQISEQFRSGALRTGSAVRLRGPFGTFGFSDHAYRPAIIVAGSTGLAPIKAMLEDEFRRTSSRDIAFFYGARTQEDLYRLDVLQSWTRRYPNFSFTPVLSDEPAGSGWTGARGLVTECLSDRLSDTFGAEAYLCGPPGMIDAAIPVLKRAGIDLADIRYDKFTAS